MPMIAKTIDGSFPDYERVIPATHDTAVTIDRAVLAAAIKRAGVLTAKSSRVVKLAFAGDMLTVTGSSAALGEAVEELRCDTAGPDIAIGMDWQYLRAALLALASDAVVLEMTNPAAPCRIAASFDGAQDDRDIDAAVLVQVVMPSRV